MDHTGEPRFGEEILYRLDDLEPRGVLLGITRGELALSGVALAVAVAGFRLLPFAVAVAVAVLLGALSALALFVEVHSLKLVRLAMVWWRWRHTKVCAGTLDVPQRLAGPAPVPVATKGRWKPLLKPGLYAVRDHESRVIHSVDLGGEPVGILEDCQAGTWTAALCAGSLGIGLLDTDEATAALDEWRSVLDEISVRGGLTRAGWIIDTRPGDPTPHLSSYSQHSRPARSGVEAPGGAVYRTLAGTNIASSSTHELTLWVQSHVTGRGDTHQASCKRVVTNITYLAERLSAIGVPVQVHGPDTLGEVLARHLQGSSPSRRTSWEPLDVEEDWKSVNVDGRLHSTWWVKRFPTRGAPCDFLAPLLVASGIEKRVACVYEPIPETSSLRDAERALRGFESDLLLSAKTGRKIAAEQAERRLHEISRQGASDWRWSLYVGVDSYSKVDLDESARVLKDAAGRCGGLRLVPLLGQQHKALWATTVGGSPLGDTLGAGREMQRKLGVPAHRSTSMQLCACYPLALPPTLSNNGVYVGTDGISGSAVAVDPIGAYRAGLVSSYGMVVTGGISSGKSSLVKSLIWRCALTGVRSVVLDPKGEYGPLATAMGAAPLLIRPHGPSRINPLDVPGVSSAEAKRSKRTEIVTALIAAARHEDLNSRERVALAAGISSLDRDGVPVLDDLIARLTNPLPSALRHTGTTKSDLIDDARDLVATLRRFVDGGDLGGIFDGPTSVPLDSTRPLICDLSACYGGEALPLVMLTLVHWVRLLTAADDKALTFLVVDEAALALANVHVARVMTSIVKISRQIGLEICWVYHRQADLDAAGDSGSEIVARLRNLAADCGIRVFYRQSPSEARALASTFALNRTQTELLSRLPRGTGMWQIGNRSLVVEHAVCDVEAAIVDTDQRLRTTRMSVMPGVLSAASEDAWTFEDNTGPVRITRIGRR